LFDRHAGRVSLTSAGRRLYELGQRVLALHQEARREIAGAVPAVSSELHLAASTVPAEHLLPIYLQAFQQAHPEVHVVAVVADSAQVLASVEQGEAALALVGRPGPASWAESRPFARERLVLIVPPGHRWVGRKSISMKELKAEPLLLREPGSGSRACLEEELERSGHALHELRIVSELGSNEAIKEAVLRGVGVAWMSAFAVHNDLVSGRLCAVPVAGLNIARDLFTVTDRRRVLPLPARMFLAVLAHCPFQNSETLPGPG